MKQKKHFTHAIQFKFLLLRMFISAVILVVSIASIIFMQGIVHDSLDIVKNELPFLQNVQEVRVSVLSTAVSGMLLINTADVGDLDGGSGSNIEVFKNELSAVRSQLTELASHTSYRKAFDTYIDEILLELSDYERTLLAALNEDVRAEALESKTEEEYVHMHAQALSLQEEAKQKLAAITTTFDEFEAEIKKAVDAEVLEVGESSQNNQILITLLSVLGILVTLFVGLLFSNRTIVQPLKELTSVAEQMADGKLSLRVDIPSRDEIGKLSYTFNKMAAKLETSYDSLEKIVEEKTDALEKVLDQFETKNEDLEKSQMATINLLEDLEEEKRAVEERVKMRTQELEREKNKLLQVTSNMRGGGILLDDSKEVVFVNDETYRMLGIPKDAPVNTVIGSFLAHFEGDAIKSHFKKCIEGNTFHVPEIDGGGRVYEIFFHHLRNAKETSGYFILVFDITDAKLLERSKSELVAVASHQLRTPLTAMRGNVEMLIDESFGALNKEQHELLDDIEVSTIRLITMVNEMLDITKIERGNLEMQIEEVNIKEIISSVIGDLDAYAQRHEFTITETLPSDVFVKADKVRLRQVFQNLVDNAIKYSNHPGALAISAKVEEKSVEISFKDNGIGVPKNEQQKLFERFYRASNTAKTASSGSGLGLYIVKSIANQLGGDIRFESEEHKGTTFFVTLPLSSNKA